MHPFDAGAAHPARRTDQAAAPIFEQPTDSHRQGRWKGRAVPVDPLFLQWVAHAHQHEIGSATADVGQDGLTGCRVYIAVMRADEVDPGKHGLRVGANGIDALGRTAYEVASYAAAAAEQHRDEIGAVDVVQKRHAATTRGPANAGAITVDDIGAVENRPVGRVLAGIVERVRVDEIERAWALAVDQGGDPLEGGLDRFVRDGDAQDLAAVHDHISGKADGRKASEPDEVSHSRHCGINKPSTTSG